MIPASSLLPAYKKSSYPAADTSLAYSLSPADAVAGSATYALWLPYSICGLVQFSSLSMRITRFLDTYFFPASSMISSISLL